MLTTLRIKNLALVEDLTIEFRPGFNAITGETGAGKSILIGGLNLALGERADRTLLRSGADQCSVEAIFDVRSLSGTIATMLEENGLEPCEEHQLLVKRIFTAAGTNRQFLNGSPTTLAVLKQVGEALVDIHGPHDHQSLLHSSRQLAILDAYGGLQPAKDALAKLVTERSAIESQKADLVVDEQTYAQQLDLLRHQVHEIESAKFQPGEEEELEAEHARVSNAAQLMELAQGAMSALNESENALLDQAGQLGRLLNDLHRIDPGVESLTALHDQAIEQWRELSNELARYADRLEVDPSQLAQLEERLNRLHSLKRKYGGSVGEINAFGQQARAKLDSLESRDADLERLNQRLAQLDKELTAAAVELRKGRNKLLPKLAKAVTGELQALGFARSHFEITLTPTGSITAQGGDACEFLFAPNVGEPARPLRAIASSGEMARVMLALKTVLAAEDEVPLLVFDEVDANVGGETASVVGEKMREIGAHRQVLCITHLPAVAAAASTHFEVRKEIKDGRTHSFIRELAGAKRRDEIARMLGGKSEAAQKHADALLEAFE